MADTLAHLRLSLDVTFRQAEKSDLPKLEWGGEYRHFRTLFARTFEEQKRGTRYMLIADVNRFPVGQVFMQMSNPSDLLVAPSKRAYLYSLRVMEAFQGMGIGSALVQHCETMLREYRYAAMSIAAAKENPRARRLYERLGFKVFAEDPGRWHYVDHEGKTKHVSEPCWLMEKLLTP